MHAFNGCICIPAVFTFDTPGRYQPRKYRCNDTDGMPISAVLRSICISCYSLLTKSSASNVITVYKPGMIVTASDDLLTYGQGQVAMPRHIMQHATAGQD